MLNKLLKHDIKAISKFALPMLGGIALATILIGLIIGGAIRFGTPQTILFAGMTTFLLIFGVIIAAAILNVLVIARFYTNLMTDEGYLSFTLPVTATEHICSKLLTTLLFMLITAVVETISIFIAVVLAGVMSGNVSFADLAVGLGEFGKTFAQGVASIFTMLDIEAAAAVALVILSGIFSLTFNLFSAYYAMTVAGMARKAKFFIGLAIYFGITFVVERLISVVVIFSQIPSSLAVMCISIAVRIAGTAALFFLTRNMLTKGLNLN